MTNKRKIITVILMTVFLAQWIAQSIPHHETIMADGETMCTCGCGHTVAVCAASHQSLTLYDVDCSCRHQQTKPSLPVFAPHKITDMTLTASSDFYIALLKQHAVIKEERPLSSMIIDIPKPPPKYNFG